MNWILIIIVAALVCFLATFVYYTDKMERTFEKPDRIIEWLRKEHNVFVWVEPTIFGGKIMYRANVTKETQFGNLQTYYRVHHETPDMATKMAIKKALNFVSALKDEQ